MSDSLFSFPLGRPFARKDLNIRFRHSVQPLLGDLKALGETSIGPRGTLHQLGDAWGAGKDPGLDLIQPNGTVASITLQLDSPFHVRCALHKSTSLYDLEQHQ